MGTRFDRFLSEFSPDRVEEPPASSRTGSDLARYAELTQPAFVALLEELPSCSFERGLIRFLVPGGNPGLLEWNGGEGWSSDWPQWRDRLVVFAYDWLGRQIAFDRRRAVDGQPAIAMLEPGTGKVLEIPANLESFLNEEVIEYKDAALAGSFYDQWRSSGGGAPTPRQCVGYKTPLFLGGRDDVSNLEVVDLAVYISISGQTFSQVKDLPPGTKVSGARRDS